MTYRVFEDSWLNNLDVVTPCYVYDSQILLDNLTYLNSALTNNLDYEASIHYALKANDNKQLLSFILANNIGVDCVSGGEVRYAYELGFKSEQIVFAGVGKTDDEITNALDTGIYCFNVESYQELEVINQLAISNSARVMLRVNPDVDAKTHKNISTGKYDNKFGMHFSQVLEIIDNLDKFPNIKLIGLHYHIGSQICDLSVYKELAQVISAHYKKVSELGVVFSDLNLGGGLGVDYNHPKENPLSDFDSYFKIFNQELKINKAVKLHFELGRSIIAQCGVLLSKVLYTKQTGSTNFVILDAGMNDLMRPALYNANHKIRVLNSSTEVGFYDVVGPVCESTDVFAKKVSLTNPKRNDKVVIYTAGAYGHVLANTYNRRDKIKEYVY